MKNLIALLAFFVLAGIVEVEAQNTPVVDQRQHAQRHRIQHGIASGELTRREAADSRHDQRRIRRSERHAKSDGVVSPSERSGLWHKQNKSSRELRRDKADPEDRRRVK